MRFLPFLCLVALTLFASCSKENDSMPCEEPVSVNDNYFPLAIGNYWIYDRFNTDQDGNNMVFSGQDSVVIVGDTIINGQSYFQQQAFRIGGGLSLIGNNTYRDSSGYLINEFGDIRFCSFDSSDSLSFSVQTLEHQGVELFNIWIRGYMDLNSETINLNAVSFTCLEYIEEATTDLVDILDNFPKYNRNYYSSGVGRVRFNLNYSSSNQQIIYELNTYNIQ